MTQRNRSKSKAKSRKPRTKGRTVYIGQRPKTPLIIAGVFVAGMVTLILAMVFSNPPENEDAPLAPSATNAPAMTNGVSPAE